MKKLFLSAILGLIIFYILYPYLGKDKYYGLAQSIAMVFAAYGLIMGIIFYALFEKKPYFIQIPPMLSFGSSLFVGWYILAIIVAVSTSLFIFYVKDNLI